MRNRFGARSRTMTCAQGLAARSGDQLGETGDAPFSSKCLSELQQRSWVLQWGYEQTIKAFTFRLNSSKYRQFNLIKNVYARNDRADGRRWSLSRAGQPRQGDEVLHKTQSTALRSPKKMLLAVRPFDQVASGTDAEGSMLYPRASVLLGQRPAWNTPRAGVEGLEAEIRIAVEKVFPSLLYSRLAATPPKDRTAHRARRVGAGGHRGNDHAREVEPPSRLYPHGLRRVLVRIRIVLVAHPTPAPQARRPSRDDSALIVRSSARSGPRRRQAPSLDATSAGSESNGNLGSRGTGYDMRGCRRKNQGRAREGKQ